MHSPDALELEKLVLEEQCVVAFVGAAATIPPGQAWRETVRTIATRCGVAFKDDRPLPDVIDECIAKDETACNEACRELFPTHIASSRTALDYLLRLPFKALLTTNFDPWIRQHSQQALYKRVHVYPDLPLHYGLMNGLYYLHGYYDSANKNATVRALVLGERSFVEAYDESLLPGFLLNVFTYETVLFVGINPTEPRLAAILGQSISVRKRIGAGRGSTNVLPKRFILWPFSARPTQEERVLEDKSITMIRSLDIVPVFYDRRASDFRGLEELLFGWVERGELRNRPAPFSTGFDLGH